MTTGTRWTSELPFVVAHRAGNDLARLRAAQPFATMVEADVRLFRGRAEVRHLKTIGPLRIFWDRWELRGPSTPTLALDELLAAARGGVELMLDLKGRNPRLAELVHRAVTNAGPAHPLTVCARETKLLAPFGPLRQVRTVFSIGSRRQLDALERRIARLRIDAVSIHERLVDAATIARLRARADVVMAWPVRTLDEARRLTSLGVHGLITDTPELLGSAPPSAFAA